MRKPLAAAMLLLAAAQFGQTAKPSAWRPPAGKTAYDSSKDKVLYEVGYAHLDTQWRWTYLDTIGEYIPNTMKKNFALFEKYPNYIFTFSGSNRYRMMKEYYPKDFAKVKEYVRKGRWHVGGSSVEENDVNMPSGESLIRQFLYGNHFFGKELGQRSIDFLLPDCFGFPASLPSVLAHSGIKGFSTQKLTWGYPYPIPFTVGNWYGPDGKFVTSALDCGAYNAEVGEDLSHSDFILNRANIIGDKSGAFVDYRYYGTGDVGGSPSASSAEWMEKSLKGDGPVTVVAAPSDQMFRDLTPTQVAKLPTYKGDLELTNHSAGSLTSQAYMKRWNRKNELLADSAERASVAATWLGAFSYPQSHMNDAWRLILGGQFHDVLPGTSLPKAYEFSWNDEVVALNHSASALTEGAGAVVRAMDTRAKGASVVVYNPLSVAREDVVDATVRFPKAPANVRVYAPNGVEVPSQIVGRNGGSVHLLFLAKTPSVGFITYDVRPSQTPCTIATGLQVTESTLENKRYAVTLNEAGDVEQIVDKVNNHPLLAAPARLAFRFDEPEQWPAWNMDWKDESAPSIGYVGGPVTARVVENGPVRVAIEVTRHSDKSKFVQVIRLAAAGAGNRVEFDNSINWNERKTTLKTEFPLAVSNEKATYNLGPGTIQRSTADARKFEVLSHEWSDLTDAAGGYGVSVLDDCKFGSDKPDDHTLRLTLLRTPGARSYEDQATQDVGHHKVLYALEGHAGSWQGKTPWEAARLNQPLVAFQAPAHTGSLGKSFSLFRVNNPQVAITAVKKAEDSNDIIVRLYELSGAPANVTVSAAAPITAAREVNGQEEIIGKADLSKGVLRVKMSAYNPRAFAIRLGRPAGRVAPTVSVPVNLPFDVVAASFDGKPNGAGFDGKGHTFPAEMFPGSLSIGGVNYKFAPVKPNAKTAVACDGQTIALPAGHYNRLYVIASAINHDTTGTFQVGTTKVPLTVQDWSGFIGQWDNRIWDRPANAPGLARLDGNFYGLIPAYIKRDPIAYFATHRHNAKGGNDIYAYAYAFQYAIEVPAGAKSLTLPKQPNIRVLAISAASSENDDAKPAQYLYDAFDSVSGSPTIVPAAGTFSDTVDVAIRPSLYDALATVHYTTDGSAPKADSPVYTAPLSVSKNTTIKAQAFRDGKATGPVAESSYEVDDRTPPALTGIVCSEGSQLVRLRFTEAMDPDSATQTEKYRVTGTTVQSADISADRHGIDLTLGSPLVTGQSYTLTIDGVKDTSPNGNVLTLTDGRTFTAAAPVVLLTSGSGGPEVQPSSLAGQFIGSPSATTGPHGRAVSFNGTQDAIEVNNAAELNPTSAITIAAWINAKDWDGNRRIVQKGSNDDQYRFTADSGKLVFDLAGVSSLEAPLPSTGQWHHVAATYDGQSMVIYVDGEVAAHADCAGEIATTDDPLVFGSKTAQAGATDHFSGQIADLRIYNQALLPVHIRSLAGM